MPVVLIAITSLLLLAAVPPQPSEPRSLDAFAASWSQIDAYSATLTMHETAGTNVQDRAYALTFKKPSNVTVVIVSGPGHGGKVVWTGGDDVIGSPPGFLSGLKLKLPLTSDRVTTLRGDTVAMASFGWVLDHFRQTSGAKTEAPGPAVDGRPTTQVVLTVADPSSDSGLTSEVLVMSNATKLPLDVRRYIGTDLVKEIHYSDIVIQAAATSSAADPHRS